MTLALSTAINKPLCTFIECVKRNDDHPKVSINGHQLLNVLAKGGFAGSRSTRHADDDTCHLLLLAHLPHYQ
jgi:hypothetical protein